MAAAVQGLDQALGLFERLPDTARARLGLLLARLGEDISAQQQRAVPVKTGFLKAGLDYEVLLDELRLRAGLLKTKSGRSKRYYGRFVEFGRHKQNVRVVRNTQFDDRRYKNKAKIGALTAARAPLRKSYTLPVTALPARPFVHLPGIALFAQRRLANFWSEVLA